MAKQTFTVGQVLTAANMTNLQQTALGGGSTTAKTASYVLVAADAGTVVQMNSASATTITVNTALFAAGDTVQIQNVGSGVCTVTAGTATVSTAGSLAVSQYEGGQLYFNTTSAALFFDIVQTSGMTNPMTTTGDIIYSSSGSTPARLGIGTTGQVVTVASGLPSWATPASGSSFAGCRLFNTVDQSITNATATAVTFNSESFDVGGYHSTVSNTSRITIPSAKDGYYQFSAATKWPGGSTTGIRAMYLYKNGADVWSGTFFAPTNANVNETLIFTQIASAVATDYFELFVYQSTGGAYDVQGGTKNTTFQATYLGA